MVLIPIPFEAIFIIVFGFFWTYAFYKFGMYKGKSVANENFMTFLREFSSKSSSLVEARSNAEEISKQS